MSFFFNVYLFAWIFLICNVTATPDDSHLELTDYSIIHDFNRLQRFPNVLPLIVKGRQKTIILNFIKQPDYFDVPVYANTPDKGRVQLDLPRDQETMLYSDERYGASITLTCNSNDILIRKRGSCKGQQMSGYFILDGERYLIQYKKRHYKRSVIYHDGNLNEKLSESHQVFKIHGLNYTCSQKSDGHLKNNPDTDSGRDRSKRAETVYTIETAAIFTTGSNGDMDYIRKTKVYLQHVFWGIRMLFKGNPLNGLHVDVRLTELTLEQDSTPLYVYKPGTKYVDTSKTLIKLMERKRSYICDHFTMFSRDFQRSNSLKKGTSYDRSMCTPRSVSIIRLSGSFEEIFIFAHEIGHSLGASHDGDGNTCLNNTGHIMSLSKINYSGKKQALEYYKFSTCSIDAMRRYFISSPDIECLLIVSKSGLPNYPLVPTGQLYSINEQCKTDRDYIGSCRTGHSKDKICLGIYCISKNGTCEGIVPAYKTTCGNKKWCIRGKCIYDDKAPIADENCLYGDTNTLSAKVTLKNGSQYIAKSCSEVIKINPGFCGSAAKNKTHCCGTCFRLANPNMTPAKEIMPFVTYPGDRYRDTATSLKSHLFLKALAVLYFFQQMENYLMR